LSAIIVVAPPVAFSKRLEVEMTAERAFVESATRMFGSGPLIAATLGIEMVDDEAGLCGH